MKYANLVAAEYLAKGYSLSDQILQRAIEIDSKQGLSRRFVSYIQSLDTSLGARALGPGKTLSGGLQGTIAQAKAVDEQKGYSKQAGDVRSPYLLHLLQLIPTPLPPVLFQSSLVSSRSTCQRVLHHDFQADP